MDIRTSSRVNFRYANIRIFKHTYYNLITQKFYILGFKTTSTLSQYEFKQLIFSVDILLYLLRVICGRKPTVKLA